MIITEEKLKEIRVEITRYINKEIEEFLENVKTSDYSSASEPWDFKADFQDWLQYRL